MEKLLETFLANGGRGEMLLHNKNNPKEEANSPDRLSPAVDQGLCIGYRRTMFSSCKAILGKSDGHGGIFYGYYCAEGCLS